MQFASTVEVPHHDSLLTPSRCCTSRLAKATKDNKAYMKDIVDVSSTFGQGAARYRVALQAAFDLLEDSPPVTYDSHRRTTCFYYTCAVLNE